MFYCIDPSCPFKICNECCLKDIQPVIPQHPLLGPHHPLLVLPMHPHALNRVQQTNCSWNCDLGIQHHNSNCVTKNPKKYNMYGIVYACRDCYHRYLLYYRQIQIKYMCATHLNNSHNYIFKIYIYIYIILHSFISTPKISGVCEDIINNGFLATIDDNYDICEPCMIGMLKDLEAGMEDPQKSNYFLKISEHPHILFKTKSPMQYRDLLICQIIPKITFAFHFPHNLNSFENIFFKRNWIFWLNYNYK